MPGALAEIVHFQIQVAEGWIKEARALKSRPRLQFVSYFTALNALYWMWGLIDGRETFSSDERTTVLRALDRIPNDELPRALRDKMLGGLKNEALLIQAVVGKFDEDTAARILAEQKDYVHFLLVERGRPIHRMDKRSRNNSAGDASDAKKYLKWLRDENSVKKLQALASTLYLIRCNLMHGSKVDDLADGLVGRSVPPLCAITEAALECSRRCHIE